MRDIKTAAALAFLFLSAMLVEADADAAQEQTVCAIRVQAVDAAGRPVEASVEVLGAAGVRTSGPGSDVCVELDVERIEAAVLITADGYQPHATAEMVLRRAAGVQLVVTLVRPFAEAVTVQGRASSLIGIGESASSGVIGSAELAARPRLKASDLIEAVPGVATTEHSTGGHAPIVLLRGYNLDHGTDFATSLERAPMNLPSHAHAQGYTDLNFLIEELVTRVEFQKGPYSPRTGNFGTAGSVNLELADTVEEPYARLEGGANGFLRLLGVASFERGRHRLLVAAEANHDNGPSDVPDDYSRLKGVLRYSSGPPDRRHSLTLATFGSSWSATDGYPRRALERDYISRFGTLDPSDGGRSQQYLLSAARRTLTPDSLTDAGAYVRYYDLDLFSNLTFWTVSQAHGDQIWQSDGRLSSGGHVEYSRSMKPRLGLLDLTGGVELRHDAARLRLKNTSARVPVDKRDDFDTLVPASVSDNRIGETNLSGYADVRLRPAGWLRISAGVRTDAFRMQVTSDRAANSGTRHAAVVSPKASLALGPWGSTEFYANAGRGFHSNHAAGVLQRVDPVTGDIAMSNGHRVESTPPIAGTTGAEIGLRTQPLARTRLSLALWSIRSDSELLYTPEDGVTSPERPGQRWGVEWLNFVQLRRSLTLDLDAAWSSAHYRTDPRGEGRAIPDAASVVVTGGLAGGSARIAAALRMRYVGRRPLLPSQAAYVEGSFTVNAQTEFRVSRRVRVSVQAFNLLNHHYEDTAYYFATRIRDPKGGEIEPAAIPDYVTHPGRPITINAGLRISL